MTVCQQFYFTTAKSRNLKSREFSACESFPKHYLVEAPLYGIREEKCAHCAWCAKTEVINQHDKIEEVPKTDPKYKPCSKYCKMQDITTPDGSVIHCTDCPNCEHKNKCMTAKVTVKAVKQFNQIAGEVLK